MVHDRAPVPPTVARVVSAARSAWRRVPIAVRWIALGLVLFVEVFLLFNQQMGGSDDVPGYVPRTVALRRSSLELFAPDAGYRTPRAVIVFFGNDVGFWGPHRQLAAGLARDGYAVVGVDIRPVLRRLPDDEVQHAEVVRVRLDSIIAGAYKEFGAAAHKSSTGVAGTPSISIPVPLLLAGHSLGAELALWATANMPLPALRGVVAISPGSRSHLTISASGILMTAEPIGPGSFAVSDLVHTIIAARPDVRMAVVRGSKDPLRAADPRLLESGGSNIRRFGVPMAGHSMKRLALAGLVVRRALDWVLVAPPLTSSGSARP